MTRIVNIALGQLGPVQKIDSRASVVRRLCAMMREAKSLGADVIAYPELARPPFPRWYIEDVAELHSYYEREMPSRETLPLFELAKELGIGFYLGYAELAEEAGALILYNTAMLVDKTGSIVGKYRKIHVPGHFEHEPWRKFQHLEKRYFTPGKSFDVHQAFGGTVGMALCNDRRWAESYRVMALQGAEMIFIGYNTPVHNAPRRSTMIFRYFITSWRCRRVHIKTAVGWQAWPRAAWKKACKALRAVCWWHLLAKWWRAALPRAMKWCWAVPI